MEISMGVRDNFMTNEWCASFKLTNQGPNTNTNTNVYCSNHINAYGTKYKNSKQTIRPTPGKAIEPYKSSIISLINFARLNSCSLSYRLKRVYNLKMDIGWVGVDRPKYLFRSWLKDGHVINAWNSSPRVWISQLLHNLSSRSKFS